ncbi:NUDIX hydrolase [Frigidibacter sp. MR17.24]|uniref:NUDIX hydrolase n=1 Tax=Frigidibacter sp. MR17.24 TaxID=3127345 RepID=UPI003012B4AA
MRPTDAAARRRLRAAWIARIASPLAGLLGRRPPALQVAALCLRGAAGAEQVLLITSRGSGRWVLPKGWPMKGRSLAGAAQREAWEEAGVTGAVGRAPLGTYHYLKYGRGGLGRRVSVNVYPLWLRRLEPHFPEAGQRDLGWFAPAEAAALVAEPELAALLRALPRHLPQRQPPRDAAAAT